MSLCADPAVESSVALGFYRHYKGGLYKVLALGTHSETVEPVVIYEACDNGELWVRPLSMFKEFVQLHGRPCPRFVYAGDFYGPAHNEGDAFRARCA